MRQQLTVEEAYLILAEIKARAEMRNLSVIDPNFPKQSGFIQDPSRRKAALCTRRAGKTNGAARGLVEPCLQHEEVSTLYIGLTYDTCRRTFWRGALKPLLSKYQDSISFRTHESRLEVTFANGSVLSCLGMDAKAEEMDKLLGGKYKRVVIDEAGSYRVDVEKMIDEMLWPALSDHEGDVWLLGTPVSFTNSYFYKVTRQDGEPRIPGWSVHEWRALDNPYMRKQTERDLKDIAENRPKYMETPAFKRMWLGQWQIDLSKLVYKYDRKRNWVAELPGHIEDYTFGLGVDLGFNDSTAFVLSAYSPSSRRLYLMKPWKESGMDITAVARKIHEYQRRYSIMSMVVDGSNRQAVEEMRRRLGLPLLEAADKHGKAEFIDVFNGELIQGDICLVGEETAIMEEEWGSLIWDESVEHKRVEHPGCENHLSDAALYIWRKQYQYLYVPPVKPERKTDAEMMDQFFEERAAWERLNDEKPFWEKEWA